MKSSDITFTGISKLNQPVPALVVDRLRRRLGHFRRGRNAWGLNYEIAVERTHATTEPLWRVLGTVLHELIHLWQEVHGSPPKSTKFNYHNREYRDKALSLGVIVDRWGHTRFAPANSPFLDLLRQFGVEVPVLPAIEEQESTVGRLGTSKLKLWVCQCSPPVRVRVARPRFNAKCLDCGHLFERKD